MNKEMKFTPEQMAFLDGYVENFRTAIGNNWSRAVPDGALRIMREYYEQMTGRHYPFSSGCYHCMMNLLKDVGTIYFTQKAEEERAALAAATDPAPVKAAETPVDEPKPSAGKVARPKHKSRKKAVKTTTNRK